MPFDALDLYHAHWHAEALSGSLRPPNHLLLLPAAVIRIRAEAEVRDAQLCQWSEPEVRRPIVSGKVRVSNHARFEGERPCEFNPSAQDRIEEEWFPSFEVHTPHGRDLVRLPDDVFDPGEGHRALRGRAAPDEAMIAFVEALVGEQEVDAR